MSSREFRQLSIPDGLAKAVVAVIRQHDQLGYRTLSDFGRHAITDKLRVIHGQLALLALRHTMEHDAAIVQEMVHASIPEEYRQYLGRTP